MPTVIPFDLRVALRAFCLVGTLLGIVYLFFPAEFGERVGWPAEQPFDQRVIGSTFLAFALAAFLAARETEWARVRIVVRMSAFWTALAALLSVWGLLFGGLPTLGWVYVAMLAVFALLFGRHSLRSGAA